MGTGKRRSALSYIPGYKNNAVLQLIIASGVAYMMLAISWALVMIVYVGDASAFNTYFIPNIGLGQLVEFKSHWWTILTYGMFQFPNSFMELLSNMVWLYCFGSVVQMLVGHKQVIPLYLYSLFVGGIFFYLFQLLPGKMGMAPAAFLGARAGLVGMAIAAITLTPSYRFYITETFTIPLMLVVGVFVFLMIAGSGFYLPVVGLMLGGALMGFAYVKLLRAGYKPAEWAYDLGNKLEGLVTPSEQTQKPKGRIIKMYHPQQGISQSRIDEILDKINQKGYNSLTKEEKDMLLRAGSEQ